MPKYVGQNLVLVAFLALVPVGCQSVGETLADLNPLAEVDPAVQSPMEQDRARWWNANRAQAEFVPGKGYRLEGVEGYLDENGWPMNGGASPVAFERPSHKDDDDSLFSAENLDPAIALERVKNAVGQGSNQDRAKELLAEGQSLFRQQQFDVAAPKFEQAAERWPGTGLAENALFMQGESLFFSDDYTDANDVYADLVKQFPNTRHLDKAMRRLFEIARYWQEMHEANPQWSVTPNVTDGTRPGFDTIGNAIRTYDNIRLSDPTGPLADDALMATATGYFAQGRYDDADYHFGLLRREYPKSEHQFQAHLLGLQCKLRRYQGADYDGTVLEEAETLAEQLLKQFHSELKTDEERTRIEQLRGKVAAQRALRDWQMAEDYAGRKQYRAARIYWNAIIKDYPGTKLADEAQSRLTETKNELGVPPVKLKWLVDVFSEEEDLEAVPATAISEPEKSESSGSFLRKVYDGAMTPFKSAEPSADPFQP